MITMTIIFSYIFHFIKVLPYFLLANWIGSIFGLFDPNYFTYESVVYGILGNGAYSLFQIFQYLGDESDLVKPLTKKKLFFLGLRPLAAGLASFVFSAILIALFSAIGGNVLGFIKNSATALIIGISSGLFFDQLTNKEFLNRFFESRIKDKLLDDEK